MCLSFCSFHKAFAYPQVRTVLWMNNKMDGCIVDEQQENNQSKLSSQQKLVASNTTVCTMTLVCTAIRSRHKNLPCPRQFLLYMMAYCFH